MFTGIIKAKGRIAAMEKHGRDVRLSVRSDGLPWRDYEVGESIAAVELHDPAIVDISPLAGLPLQALDLSGTHVVDITPLEGMPLVPGH